MIASIDGATFGTPEDEIDNIIAHKLQSIIDDEGLNAQTLDQPSSNHVGDNFGKIQLGLKLIPNLDQHTFLLKRMSLAGGDGQDGIEPDINYSDDVLNSKDNKFFEWNGAQHMSFPNLVFDEDHVP